MTLRQCTIMAILAVTAVPAVSRAQGDTAGVRRLHIGSAKVDADTARTIPDSVLRSAIASFNRQGGMKLWGSATIPVGTYSVPLLAYGGQIRLEGRIDGDVVVINGDLLVASSARIAGSLTVLGGRLILEPGAEIVGSQTAYPEVAQVSRTSDNLLVLRPRSRSLAELAASTVSMQIGPIAAQLDAGLDSYNRVEGLVARVSPSFSWRRDEHTLVRLGLSGLLRTASDPSGVRPSLGFSSELSASRSGTARPVTFGIRARQLVSTMADKSLTSREADLATALLHEDYRDWYLRRGWGLFADWHLTPHTTLHGSFDNNREQTARAADPFSLLRNNEPWRANPLADDGRFRRLGLGVEIDTRDDAGHGADGWWLRATLQRITSADLSPLSLPTSIRTPLPFTGYAANTIDLDLRRYLALGPTASLHLRLLARGWLSGDPLLAQDRHSMGGGDILPGYMFREGNCDSRRTPDPAKPALCDRQMALQASYHRELNFSLGTRVGRYSIGLDHPSLVLMASTGSAWLSGDSAGRVPSNRLQSLAEWRSDVAVGLDNKWIAVYLAKSLANAGPVRVVLRLSPWF
jgi:hypothetical protein